jgi:hypothetical protein
MPGKKSAEQPHRDWIPKTDAEKYLVRRELENILRDPLFMTGKRYPNLLRYVVEETIEGRGEQLNLQMVIATSIGQGSSGRPRILESYLWRR